VSPSLSPTSVNRLPPLAHYPAKRTAPGSIRYTGCLSPLRLVPSGIRTNCERVQVAESERKRKRETGQSRFFILKALASLTTLTSKLISIAVMTSVSQMSFQIKTALVAFSLWNDRPSAPRILGWRDSLLLSRAFAHCLRPPVYIFPTQTLAITNAHLQRARTTRFLFCPPRIGSGNLLYGNRDTCTSKRKTVKSLFRLHFVAQVLDFTFFTAKLASPNPKFFILAFFRCPTLSRFVPLIATFFLHLRCPAFSISSRTFPFSFRPNARLSAFSASFHFQISTSAFSLFGLRHCAPCPALSHQKSLRNLRAQKYSAPLVLSVGLNFVSAASRPSRANGFLQPISPPIVKNLVVPNVNSAIF
jgi:hypothetical protein